MTNEIEILVTKRNKAALGELGADAKKAGKEVEEGLKKGFKGAEDAAEKSTKQIGNELEKTSKKAAAEGKKGGTDYGAKFGEGLEGALNGEDMLGKVFDTAKGKGGILAAGASIGAALLGGVAQSFEQKKLGGMIAAQVGASSEEAGKFGHAAGKIYADNFGDSMEEVGDAIRDVIKNKLVDASSSEEAIKQVTEQVMTVSKVVGEETGRVARAVRQMLVNGLADSATEAMDIVVQANKKGLNSEEDLIDTIVEYSTKFRDLGISGPEAMGLISQAMDNGARDTDFAADALKEFAIRAIDGSETTARGFRSLGLDAGQMGEMIAAGGSRAHEGLRVTLNAMRSIHDPVMANQIAVDLFGTKAEDLGRALNGMDLDTAASKFGEFAGKTQEAADTINSTTPAWEALKRNLSDLPADSVDFLAGFMKNSDIDVAIDKLKDYNEAHKEGGSAEQDHKDNIEAAERAVRESTEAIAENTTTLEENIEMSEKAAGGVLDLWKAQGNSAEALEKANASLKENGKTLDAHTEKGRANRDALSDVVDSTYDQIAAMEKQGASAQEIQGFMASQREAFVKLAVGMGLSATEANNLADKLVLISGNYRANVYADTSQANAAIQNTSWMLSQLRDKTIRISVQQSATLAREAKFGSFATGGVTGSAAGGGPRSNRTLVGEQGPEIVDLAPGSMVHSNPDSMRMLGEGGGGWRGPLVVEVRFTGDTDSAMASGMAKMHRDGLLDFLVTAP